MELFKTPIKVVYITKQDPNNVSLYSGTHFFMMKSLSNHVGKVLPVGPVEPFQTLFRRIQAKCVRMMSGKTYRHQYNIGLAKASAGIIQKKIKRIKPDILIGSLVSPEVAFLETDVPLLLTTDATFPLLKDYYQSHSNLHPKTIKEAKMLEQKAFHKADKLILPLQWLANSAVDEYDIDPDKIEIVPYGPNIVQSISEQEFEDLLTEKLNAAELNLLFIGVRWKEKGGPIAVDTVEQLNKMGVMAKLTVCGIEKEDGKIIQNKYVDVAGRLDKSKPEDLHTFNNLFKKSHFFILPTQAECICMSCLEAASFGVPVFASDTGGVPESVEHGKTGKLLPVNESGKEYAEAIRELWKDKKQYEEIARNSYQRYCKSHNWNSWGKKARQVAEDILPPPLTKRFIKISSQARGENRAAVQGVFNGYRRQRAVFVKIQGKQQPPGKGKRNGYPVIVNDVQPGKAEHIDRNHPPSSRKKGLIPVEKERPVNQLLRQGRKKRVEEYDQQP